MLVFWLYARYSSIVDMICLGYYTILMRIAENQKGTELSDYACKAFHMMFYHPDPVETRLHFSWSEMPQLF